MFARLIVWGGSRRSALSDFSFERRVEGTNMKISDNETVLGEKSVDLSNQVQRSGKVHRYHGRLPVQNSYAMIDAEADLFSNHDYSLPRR